MAVQRYHFALEYCIVSNTRSRHEDTDFVTFTVSTATSDGRPRSRWSRSKSLGDLNNGTYPIGLAVDLPVADQTDIIIMNYSIVNAGHANPLTLIGQMEKAGKVLSNEGAKAAAAGVGAAIGVAQLSLSSDRHLAQQPGGWCLQSEQCSLPIAMAL